ncbi:MAG TPA: radical SAM protein [Thermoguttaceae bacterium]|nr:radical SAM protein [Thermoguttaceae bacterium]
MVASSDYRVTSEIFVVSHDEGLILYAPLKGVVAQINTATAALLRDLKAEKSFTLTDADREVLKPLVDVGLINGAPDLRLRVHEEGTFCPTHVTLFLTDACNLRCVYCYARGGDNPRPVVIPREAARAGIDFVADNARRIGAEAFSVGFHGAGEPTCAWPMYQELVDYARRKGDELGLRVSCATCTNAVMPESHARWIAENTDTATVSCDGLPEWHDLQRPKSNGSGSFDELRRTLEIFDEAGFFYAIRATITEHNVHTMAEMVEFLDNNFRVGDLQFDPLLFAGRCHESGCRAPSDEVYVREFLRAYEVARRRGRLVGFSCLSFTALKSFYCCAVSDGFTVTHDGLVTACFEACALDRPFADTFVYGRYDVERGTFDLKLDKLRRLQTRHAYNLPYCKDCFCKYMCAGDCPMHALKLGHGLERGARCEITQAIAKHRLATVVRESQPTAVVLSNDEVQHG